MVTTLWGRCGEKNRLHIRTLAELDARDGCFTIESLADKLGESPEAVRRWRQNLGRSLKRIEKEMPTAPPLFDQEWDSAQGRVVYTVRPEVRDAILAP